MRILENLVELLVEYDSGDISKKTCIQQLEYTIFPNMPFLVCTVVYIVSITPDKK